MKKYLILVPAILLVTGCADPVSTYYDYSKNIHDDIKDKIMEETEKAMEDNEVQENIAIEEHDAAWFEDYFSDIMDFIPTLLPNDKPFSYNFKEDLEQAYAMAVSYCFETNDYTSNRVPFSSIQKSAKKLFGIEDLGTTKDYTFDNISPDNRVTVPEVDFEDVTYDDDQIIIEGKIDYYDEDDEKTGTNEFKLYLEEKDDHYYITRMDYIF